MKIKSITILAAALPAMFLCNCKVKQTEEGKLPDVDVDVEKGKLPEVEVETADVEVKKKKVEVTVPDVDIEMPDEKDDE